MIWAQRNNAYWNGSVMAPETAVKAMGVDVCTRINTLIPMKTSSADRAWLRTVQGSIG